jgi:hypothetical protein
MPKRARTADDAPVPHDDRDVDISWGSEFEGCPWCEESSRHVCGQLDVQEVQDGQASSARKAPGLKKAVPSSRVRADLSWAAVAAKGVVGRRQDPAPN